MRLLVAYRLQTPPVIAVQLGALARSGRRCRESEGGGTVGNRGAEDKSSVLSQLGSATHVILVKGEFDSCSCFKLYGSIAHNIFGF